MYSASNIFTGLYSQISFDNYISVKTYAILKFQSVTATAINFSLNVHNDTRLCTHLYSALTIEFFSKLCLVSRQMKKICTETKTEFSN